MELQNEKGKIFVLGKIKKNLKNLRNARKGLEQG